MQIPMIMVYQNIFKDVETFHIWGTVTMNQAFNLNIDTVPSDYFKFSKAIINNEGSTNGVSAMSISDMTNIPRATVVRKCKYLINHNYLDLNDKKQYVMTERNTDKILPYQKEIFKDKSKFLRKTLNLFAIS